MGRRASAPGAESRVRATLLRFADSPFGAFGYLDVFDDAGTRVLRLCTAEDDWLDNTPGKSCIPVGRYRCKLSTWHKANVAAYEVTGVPNRTRILIHFGNTEENVEGCVLVGEDFGALQVVDEDATPPVVRHKWAVTRSRPAFDRLMQALAGVDSFTLDVVWAPPGSWRN